MRINYIIKAISLILMYVSLVILAPIIIAIVYKEPMSSESVVISKHNVVFGLFASLEYLAQHGNPQSIEDLLENHYICDRKEYKTEWTAWSKMLKKAD